MDESALYSLMRPRKICICKQVGEEDIRKAVVEKGARTFEEVQSITHSSTGCGTCENAVRKVITRHLPPVSESAPASSAD